jgi:hypothetical protein
LHGYREALAEQLPEPAYELDYADRFTAPDMLLRKIEWQLSECDLAVFDFTGRNANVTLEFGLARAAHRPLVVAVCSDAVDTLPSDVQGFDQLRYGDVSELGRKLREGFERGTLPPRGGQNIDPHGSYHLTIVEDPDFDAKARALRVSESHAIKKYGDAFVWFDSTLNPILDRTDTFVNIDPLPYAVPDQLESFGRVYIERAKPDYNEAKIRLRSDLNVETVSSVRGVEIQKTDYFASLSTNELARKTLWRSDPHLAREQRVCDVFDNYVRRDKRLISLTESEFSNHIGVTTLLITSDNAIVLQRQGETCQDAFKIMVGASGSADWDDVDAAPESDAFTGRGRKTLQNVVKYAVEREASEEIGVTAGTGRSKTTLTGFARYISRGGKPEFFFITYLAQTFAQIPPEIRRAEWKYVRSKTPHWIYRDADDPAVVVDELGRLSAAHARQASTSMLVAIDFAMLYLASSGHSISQLRPDTT